MRTIGLIGGLTPESTAVYYRLLNAAIKDRLGRGTSSKMMLSSFNLGDVMPLYLHSKSDYIEAIVAAGQQLKRAGVDGLMILSNSAHMAAEKLAIDAALPVVHILEAIAERVNKSGARKPLLLGTDFVMEGPFYRSGLDARIVGETIIPDASDCKIANDILFDELAHGEIRAASRQIYLDIINKAVARGADSVILGCTEHCLLLDRTHHHLPMFDSTQIHVDAAVDFQLEA